MHFWLVESHNASRLHGTIIPQALPLTGPAYSYLVTLSALSHIHCLVIETHDVWVKGGGQNFVLVAPADLPSSQTLLMVFSELIANFRSKHGKFIL